MPKDTWSLSFFYFLSVRRLRVQVVSFSQGWYDDLVRLVLSGATESFTAEYVVLKRLASSLTGSSARRLASYRAEIMKVEEWWAAVSRFNWLAVQLRVTHHHIKHHREMIQYPTVFDFTHTNIQTVWQQQIECMTFFMSWLTHPLIVNKGEEVLS